MGKLRLHAHSAHACLADCLSQQLQPRGETSSLPAYLKSAWDTSHWAWSTPEARCQEHAAIALHMGPTLWAALLGSTRTPPRPVHRREGDQQAVTMHLNRPTGAPTCNPWSPRGLCSSTSRRSCAPLGGATGRRRCEGGCGRSAKTALPAAAPGAESAAATTCSRVATWAVLWASTHSLTGRLVSPDQEEHAACHLRAAHISSVCDPLLSWHWSRAEGQAKPGVAASATRSFCTIQPKTGSWNTAVPPAPGGSLRQAAL